MRRRDPYLREDRDIPRNINRIDGDETGIKY